MVFSPAIFKKSAIAQCSAYYPGIPGLTVIRKMLIQLTRSKNYHSHQLTLLLAVLACENILANQSQVPIYHTSTFSLIGEAKYPDHFPHYDYVNAKAPKGGTLNWAESGTYDTLNPYNSKGRSAYGLYWIYDRLMTPSADEPYTLYPLLARQLHYPASLAWVTFDLHEHARFHDGKPLTAEDVVFSFDLLKQQGSPFIKNNLRDVISATTHTPYKVTFHLEKGAGKKVLAFIALSPVFPKHIWKDQPFDVALTSPPVGSGPMKVSAVKLGQFITYERVKNYWGAELASRKGLYNFDRIHVNYYRNLQTAREAFKTGQVDISYVFDAKTWHEQFNFSAVRKKQVIKETLPFFRLPGMKGLVFNTRRPLFQDRRVREALLHLYDFKWINQHLMHGDAQRTQSFFTHTPMMATGLPSEAELALLQPFKQMFPASFFTTSPSLPACNGSGCDRANKIKAITLLAEAGWRLNKGKMIHEATGQPFTFTLLVDSSDGERLTMPFRKTLASIGIQASIQTLDISQYRNRIKVFDFDMVSWYFFHSPFLGGEQANSWSSQAADELRSNNLAGIKHPAIDALVNRLREPLSYDDMVTTGQALDRLLLWGIYMIPQWHSDKIYVAYWQHIERPKTGKPFYPVLESMWERKQ